MKVNHEPGGAQRSAPTIRIMGQTRAPSDALRELVLPRFDNVRMSGGSYMVRCPAHEDGTASLSLSRGDTHPVVFKCHAGCDTADILDRLGITWADILTPREVGSRPDDGFIACGWNGKSYDAAHRKAAEYPYRDAAGVLVFAVARCALKGNGCQGFRQWRPDPTSRSGKRWSRNLPDGSRVGEDLIYRLPDVLDSDATRNVFVVEGEKDVDRLWAMGVPATCNAQGAGKWTARHADWLAGRDVIVVADRDDAGWRHAEKVTNTLLDVAQSIEVVRSAHGKDISDHLDAGLSLGKLVTVAVAKPTPSIVGGSGLA